MWGNTSAKDRGYGWEWQKLRLQILRRDNGLCQCDRCKGGAVFTKIATEVDHIIPKSKGGTDDPANLQAINKECHKRKTQQEQGKLLRPAIGLDGYPRP